MLLIKLFIIEGHWNIGKLEGAAKLLSKDPNQESQAHNSNKFIQISKKKKRKWPQCVYTNWINMFCVTLSLIELIFLRSFSMPDLTTCERRKDNFCHRYCPKPMALIKMFVFHQIRCESVVALFDMNPWRILPWNRHLLNKESRRGVKIDKIRMKSQNVCYPIHPNAEKHKKYPDLRWCLAIYKFYCDRQYLLALIIHFCWLNAEIDHFSLIFHRSQSNIP